MVCQDTLVDELKQSAEAAFFTVLRCRTKKEFLVALHKERYTRVCCLVVNFDQRGIRWAQDMATVDTNAEMILITPPNRCILNSNVSLQYHDTLSHTDHPPLNVAIVPHLGTQRHLVVNHYIAELLYRWLVRET